MIPIKLLMEFGAGTIASYAERFHLPGPLPPYPSLALGCTECSPLQAASMYSIFANRGIFSKPFIIEWIKDRWGKKTWRHRVESAQAISWETSSQTLQALKLVNRHIKGKLGATWNLKGVTAGKTGTTNENRTCWYAGLTPEHATVIYLGCDDNREMEKRIFSTHHAIPIWLDINRTTENPSKTFFIDPSLKKITVDRRTGQPCSETSDLAIEILVP